MFGWLYDVTALVLILGAVFAAWSWVKRQLERDRVVNAARAAVARGRLNDEDTFRRAFAYSRSAR